MGWTTVNVNVSFGGVNVQIRAVTYDIGRENRAGQLGQRAGCEDDHAQQHTKDNDRSVEKGPSTFSVLRFVSHLQSLFLRRRAPAGDKLRFADRGKLSVRLY